MTANANREQPTAARRDDAERRIPCSACGAPVLEGARKCRTCKKWIGRDAPARPGVARPQSAVGRVAGRVAIVVSSGVATVMAVVVSRPSPVGEAPPLTALGGERTDAGTAPAPGAIGPEPEVAEAPPARPVVRWKVVRQIKVGDVHPLDVAFRPDGRSVYVSGDDATVREYRMKTGELVHQASVPATGDAIRVLFDRFIAVLRREDAARIPVLDTTKWDKDPILLDVGKAPGDVIALPDGKTIVTASTETKRVTKFELPGGARIANITLPHSTGQLFVVRSDGQPYVAALGALVRGGRKAGAWLDLFDPLEVPFGATRRSISVGREPTEGSVTTDGRALLVPDRDSNSATLLSVASTTVMRQTTVGQAPEAAYVLQGDRWGITIDSGSRTATVIDLTTMTVESSLMLEGQPRTGVTSPDRRTLFVGLGGTGKPPRGAGVAVIAGSPPRVVASLPTGEGAGNVAVSRDGRMAAVTSYWDRSITVLGDADP